MHGVPYECPPVPNLHVTGGVVGCFAIPFPSRSYITKLIIKQTGGSMVDFTAQLFNHASTCEGSEVSGGVSDIGLLPPEMFQVTPPLNGVSGALDFYAARDTNGGLGYDFFSHDGVGQQQIARLGNSRIIYVQITPSGSSPCTFCVVIGGRVYG